MVIPFVITATISKDDRLKNKYLMPFGNCSILEHIIRRALFFKFDVIICTSEHSADNLIMDVARAESVKCFRGDVTDKLNCLVDCCDKYDIDAFHIIDANSPFFDDTLVRKSFLWLEGKRVDSVYPTNHSINGGASVGYSFTKDIIIKAIGIANGKKTNNICYFIEKVPGFRFARLKNNTNPPKSRLILDYIEDYVLLFAIERLVGTYASRTEVIDILLKRNPDLYRINWFRNKEK